MAEPGTTSSGAFAASAAAGLAPVARDVAGVKTQAQTGSLQLTEDAAVRLLGSLADARARVQQLITESGELDVSLRLGDNFIGQAMSERLQNAASGGAGAAIPVLQELSVVLDELELTVRAAAGRYTAVDEDAQNHLADAARRFGLEEVI